MILKAFACIVGYIIMINRKNTYFKSEIIKNLENLNLTKIAKITPVVYLKICQLSNIKYYKSFCNNFKINNICIIIAKIKISINFQ